ncbi:MAG: RtcB family protein [Rhodospirillales bacterium]|nr:MAG: RtcB family protein [Rhodospirillales bacterium]
MTASGLRPIRRSDQEWEIPRQGDMRVPAVLFATAELIEAMEDKVFEQAANVATLPGIIGASFAMPDAHWGYGFPIGGVAAFDPDEGGIISMGGVGFDISCGVRTLLTGVSADDIMARQKELADALLRHIPAGLGSTGAITLDPAEMDAMLAGGARWAVARGWGEAADLERTEERGCMADARSEFVSAKAKERQKREMGTLGSGNHYLEVQRVAEVLDPAAAEVYGLHLGDAVVTIHCGSRGLGHQIGTEALREMVATADRYGIRVPDRELACAPVHSEAGRHYLGAMRAAINCALANRQIITHLTREVFATVLPAARLDQLYDVSHNTCKVEEHEVDGRPRNLYVHRKGATRAFGPGHPDVPEALRSAGQPVLIGGTMGTASYVLRGTTEGMGKAFGSACHGAGRALSRRAAGKRWYGRQIIDQLAAEGIMVRSHSSRGIAEEAPGAYKDVTAVVDAADAAGLARKVVRLRPMICIKG